MKMMSMGASAAAGETCGAEMKARGLALKGILRRGWQGYACGIRNL
jgi:hypothetical protein